MMKIYKKTLIFLVIGILLLSGCGKTEQSNSVQNVLFEQRKNGVPGLLVEQGALKESGAVYEDAPIDFKDEAIEEMLRNIIGKPEGDVYISELQGIHAIYWRSESYWSNLQSLDGRLPHLSGCEEGPWEPKQPKTLEDLAYCYNLQWMEFSNNVEVPSLEPLYELPQLETLRFGQIAAVTEELMEDIAGLPHLNHLEIANHDPIYSPTTNWGEVTDGSFLLPIADQIIWLEAGGGIDWNPEVLAQMTNMKRLELMYEDDISFLEHMPNLEHIWMYRCSAKDWRSLAYSEKLECVEIWGCDKEVIDIELEDLQKIKNLDYLELLFTTLSREYSKEEIAEALPSLTGLWVQY